MNNNLCETDVQNVDVSEEERFTYHKGVRALSCQSFVSQLTLSECTADRRFEAAHMKFHASPLGSPKEYRHKGKTESSKCEMCA
jgi:hypothetical protein